MDQPMDQISRSLVLEQGKRGARREPSPLDVIETLRAGLSVAAAERAFRQLDLSLDEASRAIGIKLRTLHRRKAGHQKLDATESEKVFRLARVGDAAIGTLGERDAAVRWLRTPNTALGGASPLQLLDTDVGAEAVLDLLGRIEHGVFS